MELAIMPRIRAAPAAMLGVLLLATTAASLTPHTFFSPAMALKDPLPFAQSNGGGSSISSAVPHWVPARHQQQQQQIALLPLGKPFTVAHRGASGLLPEHTLAAYESAVAAGADFIECDVVVTKDLQLVCRHESNLNSTTNAVDLFPDRIRTYSIDGERVTGVFAADLTLAEIKMLRAKQRWEFRDHSHDGFHQIATLDEFLDFADSASAAAGRAVGVYPEVKNPTWHNNLPQLVAADTTIEELIVQRLHARGYAASGPVGSESWRRRPVYLQSFEPTSLQKLAQMTDMPLVLLLGGWPGYVAPDSGLTHEELIADSFLMDLAKYVSGIGPWKSSLYRVVEADVGNADPSNELHETQVNSSSNSTASACRSGRCSGSVHPDIGLSGASSSSSSSQLQSTGLVAKLHRHGFQVHPYTMRDEQQFVPSSCSGDIHCELAWLFDSERVDGAFADYPGTLATWLQQRQRQLQTGNAESQ